jgi:hypothetical protein
MAYKGDYIFVKEYQVFLKEPLNLTKFVSSFSFKGTVKPYSQAIFLEL